MMQTKQELAVPSRTLDKRESLAISSSEELEAYELFVQNGSEGLIDESDIDTYLPVVRRHAGKVVNAILLSANTIRADKDLRLKAQVYSNKLKGLLGNGVQVQVKYCERSLIQNLKTELNKNAEEERNHKFTSNYQADLSEYVKFATKNNASDIHIEARKNTPGRVRVRINGDLITHIEKMPWNYALDQVRYIYGALTKGGDQSFDVRKHQNGVINALPLPGLDNVRLRVATTPEVDGVDMVLRLLPMSEMNGATPLSKLGYTEKQAADLLAAINLPHGLILIAGTTGSGKSTSLANLTMTRIERDQGQSKVITIEDPVEYRIKEATQIPVVNNKDGKDPWVEAIRACMRLDPDLLLVGELRDKESVNLVRQAVQTGHPALSTIHASNGLVIVERLEGLGISRDVLSSPDFLGVIAKQNLLKTLCPHCSIPFDEVNKTPSLRKKRLEVITRLQRVASSLGQKLDNVRFKNETGCKHCEGFTPGISGRTVCAEVIRPDKNMRELFKDPGKANDLKEYWLNHYPNEAQIDIAWKRVLEGIVDPEDAESELERFDVIPRRNKQYNVSVKGQSCKE